MTKIAIASAFLFALTFAAYADQPKPPGPHHPPPPEAFEACKSAKRGDACTVTHDNHTITGVCDAPPDVTQLACRPDHPPGPPPEAIEACAKREEGDRCSVTTPDNEQIAGTCSKGPNGEATIACKPDRAPDPHR